MVRVLSQIPDVFPQMPPPGAFFQMSPPKCLFSGASSQMLSPRYLSPRLPKNRLGSTLVSFIIFFREGPWATNDHFGGNWGFH